MRSGQWESKLGAEGWSWELGTKKRKDPKYSTNYIISTPKKTTKHLKVERNLKTTTGAYERRCGIWDKVFKNGPSKICGRLGPFLNTLSHMSFRHVLKKYQFWAWYWSFSNSNLFEPKVTLYGSCEIPKTESWSVNLF